MKSNFSLLALARQLGESTAEIDAWNGATIATINRKLWDPETGFYYSYDLRGERRIPIKTSSGFLPSSLVWPIARKLRASRNTS